MTKYILTDFELNGYNDSDFVCSYYDDVTNTIEYHCYGSTRFPSPTNIGFNNGISTVVVNGDALTYPTAEAVEKARLVLEEKIYQKLVANDKRQVDEPNIQELFVGMRVRLTTPCRMQEIAIEPCKKCKSTGKWVSASNPFDIRECFACKGTGQHFAGKVKDASGKQVFKKLEAGLTGNVVDWKSFGTFYSNGYSHPNRENTTVQIKTNNDELVRASYKNLSLACGYKSEAELRALAKDISYNYSFSSGYPKFAWDTRNFAVAVVSLDQPGDHI